MTSPESTGDNNPRGAEGAADDGLYRDGRFIVLREVQNDQLRDDDPEDLRDPDDDAERVKTFIKYAAAAADHLDEQKRAAGDNPFLAFEYGDIRYAVQINRFRYDKPIYHVVNLERGDELNFEEENIPGSGGPAELTTPQDTESIIDFMGQSATYAENPLVKLSRDPEAAATLTTRGELSCLARLERYGMGIAERTGLEVAPDGLAMTMEVVRLATEDKVHVEDKVSAERVVPAVWRLDKLPGMTGMARGMELHPKMRAAMLASISSIELRGSNLEADYQTQAKSALGDLIDLCKQEVNERKDPAVLELAAKLDVSHPGVLELFYKEIAKLHNQEVDDAHRALFVKTIEQATPRFRELLLEHLARGHLPVSQESLEELIANSDENLGLLALAGRVDRAVSGELPQVITLLRRALESGDITSLTDEERDFLAEAGFNPAYIPFALNYARGRRVPLVDAMALFVSGDIYDLIQEHETKESQKDELASVAGLITPEASAFLLAIIEKGAKYDQMSAVLARRLIETLPGIYAERRAAQGGEIRPLTEVEVGVLLAGAAKPEFLPLFTSDQVATVTVNPATQYKDAIVSFKMVPGTEPTGDWLNPGSTVPVKHKMVTIGGQLFVLTTSSLRLFEEGKKYDNMQMVPASNLGGDGAFVTTVDFSVIR